jgi:branched-chain amino acid transport system ATP-binding protein
VIETSDLTKKYGDLYAVKALDLKLEKGDVFGFIGPNGAGKTTIFNIVAGADTPDHGAVLFDDKPIAGLRPDQICALGIARTFQLVKPFAGLSVLDNATVGALRRQTNPRDARTFAAAILDRLGLGAKRDLPAASLTLPERKMLEIARALATGPKLLLLDEVMAGLRPAECDRLVAVLRELNRCEGVAILLIEHVMRAVMALAEKVIVLHHGEVIAEGPSERVVAAPAVRECYLGETMEI